MTLSNPSPFQIYAAYAEILTVHDVANEPITLQCGYLEYSPAALFRNVLECIEVALNNLILLDIDPKDVVGLSVTNQRETCLLWDRTTGEVLSNAISCKVGKGRVKDIVCACYVNKFIFSSFP